MPHINHPLRTLSLLVGAAANLVVGIVPLRADSDTLPDLGDASAATISPTQERKLGEDFMRRARRSLAFVDDPLLSEYIQSLGQRLVAASENPNQRFRFFLIQDPSINAFAVPGGFIGVNTGLLLAVHSEAELASVLAHETAHITQRHIPRLIAESERVSLPAMAAILASILIAGSGRQGGEAGIALTTASLAQRGLNYTRSFEEEADRVGMRILARGGFDPGAMPSFFERLQNLNRHNDTSMPEFLRTHPVTSNRIADARNLASRQPARRRVDSSEFHHARARLRAFAPGTINEIVRDFRENLAQRKHPDLNAERYGYAYALLRAGDLARAREIAEQLVRSAPQHLAYRILQADIEMAAGRYPEALAYFRLAQLQHPSSAALTRYHASALLKAKRPTEAYALLKPLIRRNTDDPTLYRLYGTAAGELGRGPEAHQALAEYHYLNGDLSGAIQQLQIAARQAGNNFYLISSIEARIATIRDEIALQQKAP